MLFKHFAARVKHLISIRSRVILILSAAITTRESVKIGFCLITEQPEIVLNPTQCDDSEQFNAQDEQLAQSQAEIS